jgi:4-coumarate--CoA ligase
VSSQATQDPRSNSDPTPHPHSLVCFPLVVKIPCVTLPKFEPVLFLQTVEKYRITWALIVPPILVILANLPMVDDYDLSSLRSLMSGAAPLGEGLTRKALARLRKGGKKGPGNPDLMIVQGYGLTETTAPCMCTKVEHGLTKIGSAGQLIPGTEAKLVDIDGNAIPIDFDRPSKRSQAGEFCLRGTTVMKGYWNNPEATKGTFLEGGWYRTGDIAEVDQDGSFLCVGEIVWNLLGRLELIYILIQSIVDRLKELIKYKGFQGEPRLDDMTFRFS